MKWIFSLIAALILNITCNQTSEAADKLYAGTTLQSGTNITSNNGQYQLWMQGDGNLVLYNNGRAKWASNTAGRPGLYAEMQPDGNLVLYNSARQAQWASGTNPTKDAELVVQDDGNLVIYGLVPTWASNTVSGDCGYTGVTGRTMLVAQNSSIPSPYVATPTPNGLQYPWSLQTGYSLLSQSGCYSLEMQTGGNLVLYRLVDHAALWASNTTYTAAPNLQMQSDGNLVLYRGEPSLPNAAQWATNTAGSASRILIMQNDGNLVLYTDRVPVWAKGKRFSYGTPGGGFSLPICVGVKYNSTTGWSIGCN